MKDLNYKKFGHSGEHVIILHGLFGMLDNWQSFAKSLAYHDYIVYIIDQRNHGRSPKTDEFNYSLLSADLNIFCDSHNIDSAHLIGHSMGGKTVMKFCLEYPYKLKSQTIVDIAPKKYKGSHQLIFEALFSLKLETIKNRTEATELLSEKIEDISVIRFLLKNLERRKEGGYRFKMNLDSLFAAYDDILDTIQNEGELSLIRSLFVRGAKSNYILDEDLTIIDDVFPNNNLETIEGAGHWIHAERPNELLSIVLDFLDG